MLYGERILAQKSILDCSYISVEPLELHLFSGRKARHFARIRLLGLGTGVFLRLFGMRLL